MVTVSAVRATGSLIAVGLPVAHVLKVAATSVPAPRVPSQAGRDRASIRALRAVPSRIALRAGSSSVPTPVTIRAVIAQTPARLRGVVLATGLLLRAALESPVVLQALGAATRPAVTGVVSATARTATVALRAATSRRAAARAAQAGPWRAAPPAEASGRNERIGPLWRPEQQLQKARPSGLAFFRLCGDAGHRLKIRS